MTKNVEIGNLIVKQNKDGTVNTFIALGRKNKDVKYSKYDISVEVTVRDNTGKVISSQKDGFINLSDPRTLHKELLSKGVINEEKAAEMQERSAKTPESIRYTLNVQRS